MIRLYGIPNCGSVKKAREWFRTANIGVEFHDFKKEGLAPELLDAWLSKTSADTLVNRKGLMWRKLDEAHREALKDNDAGMRALMLEIPTIIKRPVVVFPDGTVTVGLQEALWETHL